MWRGAIATMALLVVAGTVAVAEVPTVSRSVFIERLNANPNTGKSGLEYGLDGNDDRVIIVRFLRRGSMTDRKIRNLTDQPLHEFHGKLLPAGFIELVMTDGVRTETWAIGNSGFLRK